MRTAALCGGKLSARGLRGAVRWGGEHRLAAAAQQQPCPERWSLSEAPPPKPPVLTAYMAVQVFQDFPVDDSADERALAHQVAVMVMVVVVVLVLVLVLVLVVHSYGRLLTDYYYYPPGQMPH